MNQLIYSIQQTVITYVPSPIKTYMVSSMIFGSTFLKLRTIGKYPDMMVIKVDALYKRISLADGFSSCLCQMSTEPF